MSGMNSSSGVAYLGRVRPEGEVVLGELRGEVAHGAVLLRSAELCIVGHLREREGWGRERMKAGWEGGRKGDVKEERKALFRLRALALVLALALSYSPSLSLSLSRSRSRSLLLPLPRPNPLFVAPLPRPKPLVLFLALSRSSSSSP